METGVDPAGNDYPLAKLLLEPNPCLQLKIGNTQ